MILFLVLKAAEKRSLRLFAVKVAFHPGDWPRTRGIFLYTFLHVVESHLTLSAPENLLSGALFSAVSTSSNGRCGQTCGRSETLPWPRQIRRTPGAFGL